MWIERSSQTTFLKCAKRCKNICCSSACSTANNVWGRQPFCSCQPTPLFLYPVVDFVLHRLVSTTRCWTQAPTIPLNTWQSIAMRDSTGRAPTFHFACVRRGFNPHWWFCWNFVSDCSTSLLFWGSDSADRQSDKPKFQHLPSPRKTITFQKAWITALTLRPAIYNASRIL